jgi:formylglycine-generating enzyme required for sulfatase activity
MGFKFFPMVKLMSVRMMTDPLNHPKIRSLSRRKFIFGGLSSLSAGAVILGGCVRPRSSMPGTLQPVAIPLAPAPFDSPAPFVFETVVTDELGQIISRSSKQARYFTELLEPPKFLGIASQPKIPLEMIEIPAGEFMMGSPENEKNAIAQKVPNTRLNYLASLWGGLK